MNIRIQFIFQLHSNIFILSFSSSSLKSFVQWNVLLLYYYICVWMGTRLFNMRMCIHVCLCVDEYLKALTRVTTKNIWTKVTIRAERQQQQTTVTTTAKQEQQQSNLHKHNWTKSLELLLIVAVHLRALITGVCPLACSSVRPTGRLTAITRQRTSLQNYLRTIFKIIFI